MNKNLKSQNWLILIASYVFYGWWDYRFLGLIIFSSFLDYGVGIYLGKTENQQRRKWLLLISIVGNLGILFGFKYFNFFVDSFTQLMGFLGMEANPLTVKVLLPIGISFYTFQTLSYTIDVYEKRMKPNEDIVAFFCYVAFFPSVGSRAY